MIKGLITLKISDDMLSKKRSHLVVKRNDFIQKSRHHLSLQEQKIVLYLISHVKPDDTNFTEHVFSIPDFCRFCGMDETSGKNYSDIKEALGKLRSRYVWVTLDDGSETTLGWINKATINKRSGLIRLRLDEDLKPYLLLLNEHYTLYEMRYTLAMKSQYSIRLYELLKSYAYRKSVTFEICSLKNILSANDYERNPDFKRRVLDIAMREINEYTDLSVEYSFLKEGRRFSHVCFSISRKEAFVRFVIGNKIDQTLVTKGDGHVLQPTPGEAVLFPD